MKAKRILYIQYSDPAYYPPLERSSRILADEGFRIEFLGIRESEEGKMCLPAHSNIKVKYIICRSKNLIYKFFYLKYSLWVLARALSWRPDWIYASDIFSCPLALFLLLACKAKVVYHEHDPPQHDCKNILLRACFAARSIMGRKSDICILPSEKRIDDFLKAVKSSREVYCVWNCPMKEEVKPERVPSKSGKIVLYYHGSINRVRLPAAAIEAVAKIAGSVVFNITGYEAQGSAGYIQYLRGIASKLNIEDRIKFLGTIRTRTELYESCTLADVGFACISEDFDNSDEKITTGASNKLFDYMACGLPLLVNDTPAWRKLYADRGLGLACKPDDPEDIASCLRWFLENPKEAQRMGEKGRQMIINSWNYETEFDPVKRML